MLPDQWPRVIAASVVPVVIISACGLLCLALYNRLASIVSRLRTFQREHLHEQEQLDAERRNEASAASDPAAIARHEKVISMLELQTTRVLGRARLIRRALFCLLCTILCLTACSLCLGLSALSPVFNYLAVPLFFLGMSLLLAAVVFALLELKGALDPVELESQFVSWLADHGAAAENSHEA